MSRQDAVQTHYTIAGLPERLERALQEAGLASGPLAWSALSAFDQFHMRGLAATEELAAALGLSGGEQVLDVGAGLGGPARYLAAVHGCEVTGLELTPLYVEIATQLNVRTGLADRVRFVQGDALELPFAPERFDHAWMQHVGMNVPDKERLCRGLYRVLRPGGRLAIYDAVLGEYGPVIYPTPWARDAGASFIAPLGELDAALRAAGFGEVSTIDTTDQTRAWFAEARRSGGASPLSATPIMGQDVADAAMNFGRNIQEGRVRLVQVVARKA